MLVTGLAALLLTAGIATAGAGAGVVAATAILIKDVMTPTHTVQKLGEDGVHELKEMARTGEVVRSTGPMPRY